MTVVTHPYGMTVTYETGQEFTTWWDSESDRHAAADDCEQRGGFVTFTTRGSSS
jgi:hypothetical protein